MIPPSYRGNLGANALNPGYEHPNCTGDCVVGRVTSYQGFGIEFMATFVLFLVVASITDPKRQQTNTSDAPLTVGLTVTLCHLLAIPFTGCGINPARSLGPAVVIGDLSEQLVFWAGPVGGALAAAMFYMIILAPRKFYSGRNGDYDVTLDRETLKMNSIS